MYAIVKISGKQYKVEENASLFVDKLKDAKEGSKVTFEDVYLIDKDGQISVGTPNISGASVTAEVVSELQKGDKVIVFKKKRRKGYKVKNGHRHQFTQIKINSISVDGSSKTATKKEVSVASKSEQKQDDLKKIEGIGPKSAEHLNNAGILSFADLANAKVEFLKEILEKAGPRYNMIDPTTWVEQAQLAADGKWDELKKLQDELNGGKRN